MTENYSNKHLQAYIWAKARQLIVHNAEQAVDLLCRSERIATDLEMQEIFRPGSKPYLIIREWVDVDPALEFRTFISNNEMTAFSQMATMDVRLHYPQNLPPKSN